MVNQPHRRGDSCYWYRNEIIGILIPMQSTATSRATWLLGLLLGEHKCAAPDGAPVWESVSEDAARCLEPSQVYVCPECGQHMVRSDSKTSRYSPKLVACL